MIARFPYQHIIINDSIRICDLCVRVRQSTRNFKRYFTIYLKQNKKQRSKTHSWRTFALIFTQIHINQRQTNARYTKWCANWTRVYDLCTVISRSAYDAFPVISIGHIGVEGNSEIYYTHTLPMVSRESQLVEEEKELIVFLLEEALQCSYIQMIIDV